jgi:hypothetical protein
MTRWRSALATDAAMRYPVGLTQTYKNTVNSTKFFQHKRHYQRNAVAAKLKCPSLRKVVSVLIKPYFQSNADHLAEARLQQQ